ncbi:GDSL esterase/lipase 1-like [Humulus lupulus]|uniref:GDSL esterase/lipase 1-like n=1 Tax=Humulus lupulus TaxID=3486 RepID=UPI002B416E7F|nr:GDSL esterase/lipase 1-like [Humulus lupulus]
MASVGLAAIAFLWFFSLFIINPSVSGVIQLRLLEKHVAFFVFGDSLYDPGNNNYINTTADYQANFCPYGKTFFHFPTGRFSDGRLIPDFISQYAGRPLIPPYLKPGVTNYAYGVNFASGGAGVLVESHRGFVVDLQTQLRYFKKVEKRLCQKLGPAKAKKLISAAVYLFSAGGNDYISRFTADSTVFDKQYKKEYVGMVLGNLTQVLQEIYKTGGRKFAFVSVPPLGCLPGIKVLKPENKGACYDEITSLAKLHNIQLPKVLRKIQSEHKDFNYTMYDLFTSISERIDDPSKYGFKDASMGCCGGGLYRGVYSCGGKRGETEFELCDNVGDYFFFDSVHPSEKAYKQLSQMFWSGGPDVTCPYNLEQFFEF